MKMLCENKAISNPIWRFTFMLTPVIIIFQSKLLNGNTRVLPLIYLFAIMIWILLIRCDKTSSLIATEGGL